MPEETKNIQISSLSEDSVLNLQRFSHEAMATTFEIFVQSEDSDYAKKTTIAAFEELDSLENQLSRHIENSDISGINHLAIGETARIGLPAFECLNIAKDIHCQTNGAFDVTVGFLYDSWIDENNEIQRPSNEKIKSARECTGINFLEFEPADYSIRLLADKICLDLGCIGKGHALDQIAQFLRDWSIDKALIHGGYSTILALNPPDDKKGWPINLSNPQKPGETLARFDLKNSSLSVSGLLKGQHIIDPRTAEPVHATIAAWALAETAAKADALSTAFMVMNHQEIERYCHDNPHVLSAIIKENTPQKIYYFGSWNQSGLLKNNTTC
ncbi:MAG: FAD:protein FMN transferase [Planctomycetota bacterium]|jgi:thiamine biosynthesis lipoprotein